MINTCKFEQFTLKQKNKNKIKTKVFLLGGVTFAESRATLRRSLLSPSYGLCCILEGESENPSHLYLQLHPKNKNKKQNMRSPHHEFCFCFVFAGGGVVTVIHGCFRHFFAERRSAGSLTNSFLIKSLAVWLFFFFWGGGKQQQIYYHGASNTPTK